MKVEVKENKGIKFPCLMVHDKDLIVLAEGVGDNGLKGTVLLDGSGDWEVGEYSDEFDRSKFKLFNGSVTLSND